MPTFGKWMARAGADLLEETDLIMPVPLHRRRLISRRFNQSAMLAEALHKETLIPVLHDGLERVRATQQQVGLTPAKRHKNVMGAFIVRRGLEELFEGRHILLIDDVVTSGATVEACTKALYNAGVAAASVLSLARVPNRP